MLRPQAPAAALPLLPTTPHPAPVACPCTQEAGNGHSASPAATESAWDLNLDDSELDNLDTQARSSVWDLYGI